MGETLKHLKESPEYQRGYHDGFNEGRMQTFEQLKDLFHQADAQIPRQILINVKDIDPELLKLWYGKKD